MSPPAPHDVLSFFRYIAVQLQDHWNDTKKERVQPAAAASGRG